MIDQNKTRRDFLKLLFGAAALAAAPSVVIAQENYPPCVIESGMEIIFSRMVRRFDSFSADKKRKYIRLFDRARFSGTTEDSKELADEMNADFREMKIFFEKRLEAAND